MIRCSLNLVVMLDMCIAFVKRAATSIAETIVSISYIECNAKRPAIERQFMYTSACFERTNRLEKRKVSE